MTATPAASGRSGGASASTGKRIVIFSTTDIRVACTGGHARRTNGSRDNPTIVAQERRGCGCCDRVVLRCWLFVGFDDGRAVDRGRGGRRLDDLRDVLDRTDHHAPTDHYPHDQTGGRCGRRRRCRCSPVSATVAMTSRATRSPSTPAPMIPRSGQLPVSMPLPPSTSVRSISTCTASRCDRFASTTPPQRLPATATNSSSRRASRSSSARSSPSSSRTTAFPNHSAIPTSDESAGSTSAPRPTSSVSLTAPTRGSRATIIRATRRPSRSASPCRRG